MLYFRYRPRKQGAARRRTHAHTKCTRLPCVPCRIAYSRVRGSRRSEGDTHRTLIFCSVGDNCGREYKIAKPRKAISLQKSLSSLRAAPSPPAPALLLLFFPSRGQTVHSDGVSCFELRCLHWSQRVALYIGRTQVRNEKKLLEGAG